MRTAFAKAFSELDKESAKDNQKALEALAAQGINIITPNAEQLGAWKSLGMNAAKSMVDTGAVSQQIVDKLDSLLKTD